MAPKSMAPKSMAPKSMAPKSAVPKSAAPRSIAPKSASNSQPPKAATRTRHPKARTAPPPRATNRAMPKVTVASDPVASSKRDVAVVVPPKRPPKVPSTPPISPQEYERASAEAYRRIGEEKAKVAAKARAQIFVDVARTAHGRGDSLAAVQHYRLALQVFDDPAVSGALLEAEGAAAHFAAERASKHAREAEKAGDWSKAAAQWKVAYDVRPNATVAERCANALVQSAGDFRRAVNLAQEAALAEPDRADIRSTLAEALLGAGLLTRARAEVNRALALAPQDPRAKNLLARIKRSS
jgi:tetratricopeptide (TPR) repeat protein